MTVAAAAEKMIRLSDGNIHGIVFKTQSGKHLLGSIFSAKKHPNGVLFHIG